jgi:GNAT superfamily N-acetyltransferase
MGNIVIRKAFREDCPRLLELVKGLAEYEKAPEEVTVSLSHFEESGFGDNPVWWAFVAETDEWVCGFSLYYIRYSTWKGQRIYLEDIYVVPEMRGKGIGAMLFDAVMQEGKSGDFSGMMWQALDWNQPALDFYSKYGTRFEEEWVNCSIEFKNV